jgi:hypothetical protein
MIERERRRERDYIEISETPLLKVKLHELMFVRKSLFETYGIHRQDSEYITCNECNSSLLLLLADIMMVLHEEAR